MPVASLMPTDFTTERRLRRASSHVSSFWLPIKSDILESVRHAALEGDVDSVKKNLLLDPNLYLYICREQAKDGIVVFNAPKFDDVKRFLPVEAKVVSPHRYEEAAELQLKKTQELSASLATVLELADGFQVDDKVAYLGMVFRSLGLQLILWNYNDLYIEALEEVRPSDSLESILTRRLGFSPAMLALKVVSEWGLSSQIFDVISQSEITTPLKELCLVGETFARATLPELYPTAERDWSRVKEQIKINLGENGIQKIESRYSELVRSLPITKFDSFKFDSEHFAKGNHTSYSPPKIISTLPYDMREVFYDHYNQLGRQYASESLKNLVDNVWPSLSFNGMQVFTYDPVSKCLVKKSNVGNSWFDRELINLEDLDLSDPFLKVYSQGVDIAAGSLTQDTETRSYLLLPLKGATLFGVLYLEGEFYLYDDNIKQIKKQAQALQVTLVDTLLS
jgi:hypothetical protein